MAPWLHVPLVRVSRRTPDNYRKTCRADYSKTTFQARRLNFQELLRLFSAGKHDLPPHPTALSRTPCLQLFVKKTPVCVEKTPAKTTYYSLTWCPACRIPQANFRYREQGLRHLSLKSGAFQVVATYIRIKCSPELVPRTLFWCRNSLHKTRVENFYRRISAPQ